MKQTYLFYDIETSGLNKAFDQVMQFASIRTDLDLNEIERHNILVRLSPDIVPSPGAIITHKITSYDTLSGLTEVDAIIKIHQLLNTPGTISLGYNTLGFDDEFLRFSFYRNLLSPYTHQYANQCSRLDIYPFVALYFLYKNDLIKWPVIQGKTSLKLEHINNENQLATGTAHDAMTDVLATLELTKKLHKEPEMWRYLQDFFNKNIAAERFGKLSSAFTCKEQTFREGLLIDGSIGFSNAYQCPVLALGSHNHYKNKTLWLRLDNEKITNTKPDTIAENTWVFALKSGEANFVLPLVERYSQHLSKERQLLATQNKEWLLSNPDLFFQIIHYHKEYTYPKIPHLDVDAALYQNGFPSNHDQQLCVRFHAAPWPEKIGYVEQFNVTLREQAIRLVGRNYPQYLTEKHAEEFSAYLRRVASENNDAALIDYRGKKRLTPGAALLEINDLKSQNGEMMDEKKISLLHNLETYLQQKFRV